MNPAFAAYAEFSGFWSAFSPETPFGREAKNRLTPYTEAADLEAIWDRTELAQAFLATLEADPVRLSRVVHHLKRLVRFPQDPRPVYGEVELFQFKKFLHNYAALLQLLPADLAAAFGFGFESQAFAQLLDTGRQSAESFYVADAYSGDLGTARAELRALDAAIQAEHTARLEQIEARFGFGFGTREFLVTPRTLLGDLAQAGLLLSVEPYDDSHCLVRPLASAQALRLADQRQALLARERVLEAEVLATLSAAARLELDALAGYARTVEAFDLAFARARLAREFQLTRPRLGPGPVRITGGRFPGCQETCRALGTDYVPLEAVFDTRVTVIFGSNMGGKTIVLKTLAFLQLCAQSGLFVPAAQFTTRVFRHFHYVGEGAARDATQGLSGFGAEIHQFNAAFSHCDQPTLVLFDEFARTTQSQEAESLLSAAMAAMAAKPELLALFSTHFRGVRRFATIRYLRMRGLGRSPELEAQTEPQDRIRLINRCMDFRLVADDGARAGSDAIRVARLLGLDPELARQAEHYYSQGS